MKTRRVLRYQCDHCPKSGCGKAAMVKHEARCFANPQRQCPIHDDLIGDSQAPVDDVIKALDESTGVVNDAVRAAANHCPACITAAIVQRRARAGALNSNEEYWVDFDYKTEMRELMSEHAREEAARCGGVY